MSVIAEIKERVDIVTGLHMLGFTTPAKSRNYSIQCIFSDHEDRHPSMTVYPPERVWCHACQRGGDIIDITQQLYHMSIRDAVDYWKLKLGIENHFNRSFWDCIAWQREFKSLKRWAQKEALKAEQRLPKPADPDMLSVWDHVFEEKRRLDELLDEAAFDINVEHCMKEIWIWEARSKKLLTDMNEVVF